MVPGLASLCIVLPVKRFDLAKGRLSPAASAQDRARAARHLFHRTAALVDRSGLGPVVVVTSDQEASQAAAGCGWTTLDERGSSHSEAVMQASEWAAQHHHAALLALSCDLPILTTHDITQMVRLATAQTLVIAPDRLGQGTNALIVSPPDAISFHFGPDSLRKHIAAARNAGLDVQIVRTPGLAVDLDEAWDLDLAALHP